MNGKKTGILIAVAVLVAVGAICGAAVIMSGGPAVKLDNGSLSSEINFLESSDVISDQSNDNIPALGQVSGANGDWGRTGVKISQEATITISGLNGEGFEFKINAKNGEKTGSIQGTASFTDGYTAKFTNIVEGQTAAIIFKFSENAVQINHEGKDTILGCDDGVTYDGKYIQGDASYTDVSDKEKNTDLSKDLRKSQMILSNVKSLLSSSDFELYKSIMTDEHIRENYSPAETAYDKDGKKICVDAQLKAIKYHAVLSGAGTEILLICKTDGKVYVAVYEVSEVRFYTNDNAFKGNAPNSIKTFANSRDVAVKYK